MPVEILFQMVLERHYRRERRRFGHPPPQVSAVDDVLLDDLEFFTGGAAAHRQLQEVAIVQQFRAFVGGVGDRSIDGQSHRRMLGRINAPIAQGDGHRARETDRIFGHVRGQGRALGHENHTIYCRPPMRAVDIIRAKRDGEALSREAIESFVSGVTDGSWEDYQASALLMAIVLKGMTAVETALLTDAMARSGDRVQLDHIPGIKVGKHSTGGVGDKVSIVLAPLAAACGVVVPKMSGRGLGHTGGTLDKLESIPGFRVALSLEEYKRILAEVGCCLIGQTETIAPADKKLYALRDVTATVESLPLIASSVMSKKLAEGSNALVLDVKCGRGAFMHTPADARALARALVSIGTAAGIRTEAFITRMDVPLGRAVGNAVEVAECIDALSGRGPADLTELIVRIASRMVQLGEKAGSDQEAERKVRSALASGAARDKFKQMIAWQGGNAAVVDDTGKLPLARLSHQIAAHRAGYVTSLDALLVGRAAVALGAGRDRKGDPVDLSAGILLLKKPGEHVAAGDAAIELRYNDASRLDAAATLLTQALVIGDEAPPQPALIMGWVHEHGETMFAGGM